MKTRRISGLLTALTLISLSGLLLIAKPVQAQTTVFSTLGSDNSFYTGYGFTEAGPGTGVQTSQGSIFTVSQSGPLFSLTVAYSHRTGPNVGHLYLTNSFADVGNTAASLESFTLTNMPEFGASYTPDVLVSVLHPILTVGTTYYLYGLETGDTYDVFNYNNKGFAGTSFYSSLGSPYWYEMPNYGGPVFPAFSVQSTPTPELASYTAFAMGGFGLLGLGLKARNRRA